MENHKCWKTSGSNSCHEIPSGNVLKAKTELITSLCSSVGTVGADGDKIDSYENSSTDPPGPILPDHDHDRSSNAHDQAYVRLLKFFASTESNRDYRNEEKRRSQQQQVQNEAGFRRLESLFPLVGSGSEEEDSATIIITESIVDDFVCYTKTDCKCKCQTENTNCKTDGKQLLSRVQIHPNDISQNSEPLLDFKSSPNSSFLTLTLGDSDHVNVNVDSHKKEEEKAAKEQQVEQFGRNSQNMKNKNYNKNYDNNFVDTEAENDVMAMLLKNTIRDEHNEFQKKLHFLPINGRQRTVDAENDFVEAGPSRSCRDDPEPDYNNNEQDNDNDCFNWEIEAASLSLALHESVLLTEAKINEDKIKIGSRRGTVSKLSHEIGEWVASGHWMTSKNNTETAGNIHDLFTSCDCDTSWPNNCVNINRSKSKSYNNDYCKSTKRQNTGAKIYCCGDEDESKSNTNRRAEMVLPTLRRPSCEQDECKISKIQKILRKPSISASNETAGFKAKRFKQTGNASSTKSEYCESEKNPQVVVPEPEEQVEVDEIPPQEFSVDEMSDDADDDGEIPGPSNPMRFAKPEIDQQHQYQYQPREGKSKTTEEVLEGEENQSMSSIYHPAHTESLMSNSSRDQNRQEDNVLLSISAVSTVSGIDMNRQPLEDELMKYKGMNVSLELKEDFDGDPLDFDEGSGSTSAAAAAAGAVQMEVLWANRRFVKNDAKGQKEIIIPPELGSYYQGDLSLSGEESPLDNAEMTFNMTNKKNSRKKAKVRRQCNNTQKQNLSQPSKTVPGPAMGQDQVNNMVSTSDETPVPITPGTSLSNESEAEAESSCSSSVFPLLSCDQEDFEDDESLEDVPMSCTSSTEQLSYEASLMSETEESIYDVEYMGRWDIFWPLMSRSEREMVGAPSDVDFIMSSARGSSSTGFIARPDTDEDEHSKSERRQRGAVDIEEIEIHDDDQNMFHEMEAELAEEAIEVQELLLKNANATIRRGPSPDPSSGGDTYAKLESCQIL